MGTVWRTSWVEYVPGRPACPAMHDRRRTSPSNADYSMTPTDPVDPEQPNGNPGEFLPSRVTPEGTPAPRFESWAKPVEEEEQGVDLRRYVAALLRYKWLVAGVTVVLTAAGLVASRFVKPQYVARATIWVQAPSSKGGSNQSQGPIQPQELLQQSGWINLLRSFRVLDEVVRDMRLYVSSNAPEESALFASFGLRQRFATGRYTLSIAKDGQTYQLSDAAGSVVDRGAVGDSIGRSLGFLWAPKRGAIAPGRDVDFSVVTPRDAAVALGQDLSTSVDQTGSFIKVQLPGTQPARIAGTVNAIVNRYVAVAADLKSEKLHELSKILQNQLDTSSAKLKNAEEALQTFRVNTITLPSDQSTPIAPGLQQTENPVYDRFFKMKIDREQLAEDHDAIQRALASASDSGGLSPDALVVIGAVQGSADLSAALKELTQKQADLRALLYKYTDQNPEVVKAKQAVRELQTVAIPRLARALLSDLEAREKTLDQQIAGGSRELKQIPLRAIEEARLERAVTIAENLNTTLRQRYEEARLAEASSIPDVSVLDSAVVPQVPTSDRGPQVIMAGLVGGLALAIGLAILLDHGDRRVRYPEQVSDDLGLSILGAIPHVPSNGKRLKGDSMVQVVEALRGIRLGLVHAYGTAGPLVVTITSPGPGDGKSFLASNLALSFADAGHRTLLIDADVRRGELHRLLDRKRRPGLIDLLGERAGQTQIIQRTEYPTLDFIGGGSRSQNAPELLASPRLARLLVDLRKAYSVIIVDTSPLGAGVDPYVLGTATGNLLLVMRTGVTDRELAGAKLEMLQRLPIRVVGAVLNDIKPNGVYRYYGYSYYMEGYEAKEEQEALPKA